jgi:hypothetical protein
LIVIKNKILPVFLLKCTLWSCRRLKRNQGLALMAFSKDIGRLFVHGNIFPESIVSNFDEDIFEG